MWKVRHTQSTQKGNKNKPLGQTCLHLSATGSKLVPQFLGFRIADIYLDPILMVHI